MIDELPSALDSSTLRASLTRSHSDAQDARRSATNHPASGKNPAQAQ